MNPDPQIDPLVDQYVSLKDTGTGLKMGFCNQKETLKYLTYHPNDTNLTQELTHQDSRSALASC